VALPPAPALERVGPKRAYLIHPAANPSPPADETRTELYALVGIEPAGVVKAAARGRDGHSLAPIATPGSSRGSWVMQRDHSAQPHRRPSAQEPVMLIATLSRLIGHGQPIRTSKPVDETTDRALGVLQTHQSGLPPLAGRVAATSDSLCWSIAIHVATSAGAAELTSGMGWPSFVCGTGRSDR
jgi:hypothetical protein